MKTLTASILLALALAACSRDNAEPAAAADVTTPSTADATVAGGTASLGAEATADTTTMPPPVNAVGCEGLTGQAQTDCIARTSNAMGTMGDAGTVDTTGTAGTTGMTPPLGTTTPPADTAGTTGQTTGTAGTSGDQGTDAPTPPRP